MIAGMILDGVDWRTSGSIGRKSDCDSVAKHISGIEQFEQESFRTYNHNKKRESEGLLL